MTATVRPVRPAELGDLAALDRRVFRHLAYPYFVLRQLYDVYGDDLLVLADDGRLLGYSLAVRGSTPRLGWVLGLGIEPAAHGHGHGRRLAEASFERLRSHRIERVRLTVNERNEPAVGLYRKLGFRVIREVADYLGSGESRLLLELLLPATGPGPDDAADRYPAAVARTRRRPASGGGGPHPDPAWYSET